MTTTKSPYINTTSKKGFKELFDLHFNTLCIFGNRYFNDLSISEDIVQEVFIKLWRDQKTFSHANAIKTYLYTSVRNTSLNHIRDTAIADKNISQANLETEEKFSNHIIEEDTFNQLYAEIKDLPSSAQEVMLLALNGLKNQEIAGELGVSVNTVKTQKKIAYAKLKNKLSPALHSIVLCL